MSPPVTGWTTTPKPRRGNSLANTPAASEKGGAADGRCTSTDSQTIDPELQAITAAWPRLPAAVRSAIGRLCALTGGKAEGC